MADVGIRDFHAEDAPELARILAAQRPEYLAHFHPFAFDAHTLIHVFSTAQRDRYWVLHDGEELTGFFMLRGFDAGFARPSFGVFVAESFAGRGFGRASLRFAMDWCVQHEVASLMLKVAPENSRAAKVYLDEGFHSFGKCPDTGHELLQKQLIPPTLP
jgi:RimJ/RimL family protein N-acetyltransferase